MLNNNDNFKECFSTDCLNAHNLKLFLEAFCGYSTFLETGFQKCKEKMDARSETQCEKSFKAFFENVSKIKSFE